MRKIKLLLDKLAQEVGIDTLESRHNDELDFHSLACWEIRSLLYKAYMTGLSKSSPLKIKTEDGYTFYRNDSGAYVDNLDALLVDMRYDSLADIPVDFVDGGDDEGIKSSSRLS